MTFFKEFEDEMVIQYGDRMEADDPSQFGETDARIGTPTWMTHPLGKGPILKWQSRIAFAPGDDAWYPKNRKANLSITVKASGL